MARPGVIFTESTAPGSRGSVTDTSTLFVAGQTVSGSGTTAQLVTSIGQYTTLFGGRSGVGIAMYDFLDVFFREGGNRAYVAKAAGTTTQNRTDALALFSRTLGPGRVAIPEGNDIGTATLLANHAVANNRIAFHTITGADVAALTTAANAVTALGDPQASRTAMFVGTVTVPGDGGTTRTVPLAAAQAGLESRRDARGDVHKVAAFTDYPYSFVNGLTTTFSDADAETLIVAEGVNVAADQFGALALKSYTTALERADGTYWMLNAANVRMAVQAEAERLGYSFLGEIVDGQGRSLGALEGALKGTLLRFWESGALFGETPADAFDVICDFGNNPAAQLAQGNVYASLNIRISPYAEYVSIDLVTTPITQAITVS